MKLKLKNVRLSYPSLFEHEKYKGEPTDKYAATFIIDDDEQIKSIKAAIKEVGMEELGKAWTKAKQPFKDGNETEDEVTNGCWTLKSTTKRRPLLLDRDKSPLTEADEEEKLYAGVRVNASVVIGAFRNNYGEFISCNLGGIQFYAHDERIGGGGASADDFDDFDDFDDDDDVPF